MADEYLAEIDSLSSKAAFIDSLFAANSTPSEFLVAQDTRIFGDDHIPLKLKKVYSALEQDERGYKFSEQIPEEQWLLCADQMMFYYCNKGDDAVFPIELLALNTYPKELGMSWITDRGKLTNWFSEHYSLFPNKGIKREIDTVPNRTKEMLKNTRYLTFISNDCFLKPHSFSIVNSFNPGAVRLNVSVFDLNKRSYEPIATFNVYSKNSSKIQATERQHYINGKDIGFKTNDADEQLKIDLQNNITNELKWAIYKYLNVKKQSEEQPQN